MWPRCAFLFSDCDEVPCEGLDNHAHFRNFGFAMLTLFRVSTGDNWNGILKVLRSIFLPCIFSVFFSRKLVSAVHSKSSNCLQMEMSWMIPYLNDLIIKTELICIKICHIFVFFSYKLVSAVNSEGSNCLQREMPWMISYLIDLIIKTELICIKMVSVWRRQPFLWYNLFLIV